VTLVIAIVLAPFVLLTLSFALEVAVGIQQLVKPTEDAQGSPDTVIIVPAHEEAAILRPRLLALKEAARDQARILVVADNCMDSTAEIARELQIEVVERFDREHRGKGFALEFGRSHLRRAPPDIVLIIDADCIIDAAGVEALIRHCAGSGSPCQATNLQWPMINGSPTVQLSTFAFYIKNVIRQRAIQRLAGRAHLLGTGMAFPWSIFEQADLATADIVEDLKLGHDLAKTGHAPLFVEDATVWSGAETEAATLSQRSRWEGGFLRHALRSGPPMLLRSLASCDIRGLWAAINVMIPPFALLLLLDFAVLVLAALAAWLTGARLWPVAVLGISILLAAIGLSAAWLSGGSRFIRLSALVRAPFYLAWKLPMYLRFAREGGPREWTRTSRSDAPKEI
jgi:cellulose synthase/poly-beta-1,6-N-acetylglucosamine synthase-like glycosyltransferase